MSDQAQSLRQMVLALNKFRLPPRDRQAKIVTVTSGKGGVGKSNFTLNFALALQSLGRRVLVFDADIGMANIDVLMGVNSQYNLLHLLKREKSIDEIIQYGVGGLPYIAGGSGLSELFSLSDDDLNYFANEVEIMAANMDYVLFDTGAGLSKESLKFIASADECLVVTTPEPTSLTDAYALIKVVSGVQKDTVFKIIVNRADNDNEARQAADKIALVARRFLEIEIPLLGHISDDRHVIQAVKRQVPFWVAFPGCAASRDVLNLAHRFAAMPQAPQSGTPSGIKGFMQKWLRRSMH
ncbi:MinD/ParA family protein [Paenibacillus farraposensis]|uniref:MinD/ParA family protein n=1 Tax=Paenibacillus farraposensis TaxID=2807095 RepID=A0ABW4D5U9_9BACL|nr:MinD/ParA family protein [Paenibacillus farraposensis]MCC3381333.1 MinD/ParA family protein [Paenibacillus farraposensis]